MLYIHTGITNITEITNRKLTAYSLVKNY
jgi:hypothetical protein